MTVDYMIGINLAIVLGMMYILLSVMYFIPAVIILTTSKANRPTRPLILYIFQAIIIPILLLFCGIILVISSWRLDPILQFQQLILFVLIFYFLAKDIISR